MSLTAEERESYRKLYNEIAVAVIQGDLLEITYVSINKAIRLPGRRGVIKGFTASSRLRMLRTIATVDWPRVGKSLFITLTYPDVRFDRTASERSRDRYLFVRSMENYLGSQKGALWRIEWKPRMSGANLGTMVPHAHLIVFDCEFIPWQMIRKWWRATLAVDGPLCTDVRRISGGKKVALYVSKYCSKVTKPPSLDYASYLNNTGRHWGIHRRNLIPWCDRIVNHHLTPHDIQLAENAARMTFKDFPAGTRTGFSLFGKNAAKVISEILRLDLDEQLLADYDAKVKRGCGPAEE